MDNIKGQNLKETKKHEENEILVEGRTLQEGKTAICFMNTKFSLSDRFVLT